jgi:hypothetical protein
MWNLTGQRVQVSKSDQTFTGTVESSRVKYGGHIQHTVVLDEYALHDWPWPSRVILAAHDQVRVL